MGVAALRGKAENYPVRGRHDLSAYDGFYNLKFTGLFVKLDAALTERLTLARCSVKSPA